MKKQNNQAFTLIELLVVVLIIGILAAVAVPQYQKAVLKSRITEVKTLINAAEKGMNLYILKNGFPNSGKWLLPEELDVNLKNAYFSSCTAGDGCITKDGLWAFGMWADTSFWSIHMFPAGHGVDIFGSLFIRIRHGDTDSYHCGYTTDNGKTTCEALAAGDPRWTIELGS